MDGFESYTCREVVADIITHALWQAVRPDNEARAHLRRLITTYYASRMETQAHGVICTIYLYLYEEDAKPECLDENGKDAYRFWPARLLKKDDVQRVADHISILHHIEDTKTSTYSGWLEAQKRRQNAIIDEEMLFL